MLFVKAVCANRQQHGSESGSSVQHSCKPHRGAAKHGQKYKRCLDKSCQHKVILSLCIDPLSGLHSIHDILKITIDAVNQTDNWDEETLSEAFAKVAADHNIKYGPLMWPSRIAMSGLMATPGGSTDIMYLIGKEETLKRLQAGLELIQSKLG